MGSEPSTRDAADAVRAAIASGDMPPGHRLVEADLVESLGVTRTRVRQALDALVAEGLVERVPNRSARVRTVSVAEAVEIVECRMALEGLLARRAAERATDEEIDGLRRHGELLRAAVAAGELLRYSGLIAQLHRLVRGAGRQATAAGLIERLQAQIVRHQFRLSLRPGRPQRSLAELHRLIAAIADRDADAAEAAVRVHMGRVIAELQEPGGSEIVAYTFGHCGRGSPDSEVLV